MNIYVGKSVPEVKEEDSIWTFFPAREGKQRKVIAICLPRNQRFWFCWNAWQAEAWKLWTFNTFELKVKLVVNEARPHEIEKAVAAVVREALAAEAVVRGGRGGDDNHLKI